MHLLILSIILFTILEFVFLEYFYIIYNLKRKRSILTTTLVFSIFGILSCWSGIFYSFESSEKITKIMDRIGIPVIILYMLFRPASYSFILKKINKKIIATSYSFYAVSIIFEAIVAFLFMNTVIVTVRELLLSSLELLFIGGTFLLIRKYNITDSVKNAVLSLKPLSGVLIIVFIIYYYLFVSSVFYFEEMSKYFAFGTIFTGPLIVHLIFKISIASKKHEETAILLERQLENQVEYYKKINSIYSELRSFRHDYKNHVMCLRNLISDNNIDEAVEYLNDLSSSADNKQKYYDTGNNMINALITDKSENAVSCNTKIEFSGVVPDFGIKNIDLCTIFSNALDNAIEACSKDISNSEKTISVESKYKQGIYFLNIYNPYFDNIILDNNGNISTSKENKDHHGFGVLNIKKAVKKYDGHTETDNSNNIFKLKIDMVMKME